MSLLSERFLSLPNKKFRIKNILETMLSDDLLCPILLIALGLPLRYLPSLFRSLLMESRVIGRRVIIPVRYASDAQHYERIRTNSNWLIMVGFPGPATQRNALDEVPDVQVTYLTRQTRLVFSLRLLVQTYNLIINRI